MAIRAVRGTVVDLTDTPIPGVPVQCALNVPTAYTSTVAVIPTPIAQVTDSSGIYYLSLYAQNDLTAPNVAPATPKRVQAFGATATGLTVTVAVSFTAGNLAVIVAENLSGVALSVADTSGNVWNVLAGGYPDYSAAWYSDITVGGPTTITVTQGSGSQLALSGIEVSAPRVGLDGYAGTYGDTLSPNSGTAAPGQSSDLVIGLLACWSPVVSHAFTPGVLNEVDETQQTIGEIITTVFEGTNTAQAAQALSGVITSTNGWACWCLCISSPLTSYALTIGNQKHPMVVPSGAYSGARPTYFDAVLDGLITS